MPSITVGYDGTLLTTWCGGRDKLWMTKSKDGGHTWLTSRETNIPFIGHSSNDGILLPGGDMLMAISSTEDPNLYLGSVRILRSTDDGETWENILELAPGPGNKCQPAMCKGEDGLLHVVYMHRHTAVEHIAVELDY